jgi:hypothetical protein
MAGRWRAITVIVSMPIVLAISVAACSGDDTPSGPLGTDAPASTTPAVAPSVVALQGEALRVYRGYLGALTAANTAGDINAAPWGDYVGQPLLAETTFYMQQSFRAGNYYKGAIKPLDLKVTAVELTTQPKTMSIAGCLDYSDYNLVKRAGDTPVPGAKTYGHVPITATVSQFVNGQWLLTASNSAWDKTC